MKGKVIADSYVMCEGAEEFRLISEHRSTELIAAKLERHIIADDVAIEPLAAGAGALIGDVAAAVVEQLGFDLPEVGQFTMQVGVVCFAGDVLSVPRTTSFARM